MRTAFHAALLLLLLLLLSFLLVSRVASADAEPEQHSHLSRPLARAAIEALDLARADQDAPDASWLIDLHTHTTTSDGADSPRELIRKALEKGIRVLAITDHDQLSYDEEAIAWGQSLGLTIIRGIELSCEWSFHFLHTTPPTEADQDSSSRQPKRVTQSKVHLLGYFTHQTPASPLSALLVDLQEKRRQRNTVILAKLKEKFGIVLTAQQVVEAGSREKANKDGQASASPDSSDAASLEYFGRPHIAKALIAAGHAKTMTEAFARFLDDGRLELEPWSLDFTTAIHAIAVHGGVAVLAHPVTLGLPLPALETELAHLLRSPGGASLRGLEVYSSKHTSEQSAELLAMADRLGLVATGGSDYHGSNKDGVPLAQFGRADSAGESTSRWRRINRRSLARLSQLHLTATDLTRQRQQQSVLLPPVESRELTSASSRLLHFTLCALAIGLLLLGARLCGGRRSLPLQRGKP